MSATTPASPLDDVAVTARVAGFVHHLRLNRFRVGPAETLDVLQYLRRHDIADPVRVRHDLRVLLASDREQWQRFDDLFEAYWTGRGRLRTAAPPPRAAGAPAPAHAANRLWADRLGGRPDAGPVDGTADGDGGDTGQAEAAVEVPLAASRRHGLYRADLRTLADPQAIARAEAVAYRLARALRYRRSRRRRVSRHGDRVDLRRTIRHSLAHGGDPLELARTARIERPVHVVLMLDTSGSMQPYSRYLLQFVKGLVRRWPRSDAFLFHTRLVPVGAVLREKDAMAAMSRLSLMAEGYGGGTRMSECLCAFNDDHARRLLGSRSVFVMLSDGYDTGEPADTERELARLRRRVRRLVWLNPLLGWRDYAPVTRTMQAALPFVDHFAPAHSLAALAALEREFARL